MKVATLNEEEVELIVHALKMREIINKLIPDPNPDRYAREQGVVAGIIKRLEEE